MDNRLEQILPLIEQIYDAALQPEIWPVFGEQLCQVVPSTDFNIHSINTTNNKGNLAVSLTPPAAMQLYFAKYHHINPLMRNPYGYITGSLFRSHEICPPEEFEQTGFYRGFFSTLNLFHVLNLTVLLEDDLASSISVSRSKEMGIYTDAEAAIFRALLPHLQRAFRIGNLLADLQIERDMLSQTLDKVPQGALVINQLGYSIFMNQSAQQMLARQDGLALDAKGKLQVAPRTIAIQLQELIRRVSQRQPILNNFTHERGGVLQIERPSGLRPYSLLIAPLNLELAQRNYQQAAALIFITDPEAQPEPPTQVLQSLYGLTPAEAKLAALLAQGKNVMAAAAELGVTYNTARTHLKRIFKKTGTRRQSELVKLLLSGPITVK